MIEITFVAFGDLRRYMPDLAERMPLELQEGTTIAQALELVGVPDQEVGLVVINEKLAQMGSELHDGDRLEVFAPVGGG